MSSENELRQSVAADPGNPLFVELAEVLRKRGAATEALQTCLIGLSKNPTCHQGRLVLARLFYEGGMYGFAVREIEALREAMPESKTLIKLMEKLAPGSTSLSAAVKQAETEVVAETDFEFDELELIGAEKPKR